MCKPDGMMNDAQLYNKVAENRSYPTQAFELVLDDTEVLSGEDESRTVGLLLGQRSMLKLQLTRSVEYSTKEHDYLFDMKRTQELDGWSSSPSCCYPSAPTHSSFTAEISNSAVRTGAGSKLTGLSNQGATCYMNSLLQSLYMTPEFRQAVYEMPLETCVEKQKDSICFQLQCLFANMQLSDQSCVETKGLTQSFGWAGAEAFEQHDVQELCRVLFDELESRLKGTNADQLIKDLFEGHMDSYVVFPPLAPVYVCAMRVDCACVDCVGGVWWRAGALPRGRSDQVRVGQDRGLHGHLAFDQGVWAGQEH